MERDLAEMLIRAYERGRTAERQNPGIAPGVGVEGEEFRQLYDAFMRLAPPRFDGSGGYPAAEEWMAKLKAKFTLCRVPEVHKVELAVQLLENSGRHWWEGAKLEHEGDEQGITWGPRTAARRRRQRRHPARGRAGVDLHDVPARPLRPEIGRAHV